ncbi:MAG: ABC transporter substrate-binding protein [Meiothermus sp.]|nr:ABC transporter substrate-binding protein [Meiothermus sp.]
MKWRIILLFGVVLLGTAAAQTQRVRMGYLTVLPMGLGLIAQDRGFYKEGNLEVELIPFNDLQPLMTALAAGQLEAAQTGFPASYVWAARGAPIKVIAKAAHPDILILAREDSGITDPEMLRGRNLGTPPVGSTPEVLFKGKVLPQYRLRPSDLNLLPSPPPTLVGGLATKRFDAAVFPQPWATIAELSLPVRRVLDFGKVWNNQVGSVLAVNQPWLQRSRPQALALIRAQRKAAEFIRSNPADAARILAATFIPRPVDTPRGPVPGPEVMARALKEMIFDWRIGRSDLAAMAELMATLHRLEYAPKGVTLAQLLDTTLLLEAGQ